MCRLYEISFNTVRLLLSMSIVDGISHKYSLSKPRDNCIDGTTSSQPDILIHMVSEALLPWEGHRERREAWWPPWARTSRTRASHRLRYLRQSWDCRLETSLTHGGVAQFLRSYLGPCWWLRSSCCLYNKHLPFILSSVREASRCVKKFLQ